MQLLVLIGVVLAIVGFLVFHPSLLLALITPTILLVTYQELAISAEQNHLQRCNAAWHEYLPFLHAHRKLCARRDDLLRERDRLNAEISAIYSSFLGGSL